jgi:hypothetical protein
MVLGGSSAVTSDDSANRESGIDARTVRPGCPGPLTDHLDQLSITGIRR